MFERVKKSTHLFINKHFHKRSRKGKSAIIIAGLLSIVSILTLINIAFISSNVPSTVTSSENKIPKEKVNNNKDRLKESPAKHFKRHSKNIEDPNYPLGHCNPQEAPPDMSIRSNTTKAAKEWSPC